MSGLVAFLLMGIVFPVVFIVIPCGIYAMTRSGKSFLKDKPSDLATITVARMTYPSFAEKMQSFAKKNGYKVACSSKQSGCIVLHDGISGTSWGFFYPVYLSKEGTALEVGIKGKYKQDGIDNPIRNNKYETFTKALQEMANS